MLLPALGKAREKARTISCINQQKQTSLAMALYADEHEGAMIFATNSSYPDGDADRNPNYGSLLIDNNYLSDYKSVRCMLSVKGSVMSPDDRYGAALYPPADIVLPGFSQIQNTKYGIGIVAWKVKNPATYIMVGDSYRASTPHQISVVYTLYAGSSYYIARHGGVANLVFIDGHAESVSTSSFSKVFANHHSVKNGKGYGAYTLSYFDQNGIEQSVTTESCYNIW